MRGLWRLHIKRLWDRLECKLAWCVTLVLCSASFVEECIHYYGFDAAVLPNAGLAWIGFYGANLVTFLPLFCFLLLPFVASLVYADALHCERKSGLAQMIAIRTQRNSHVVSSACISFIGAAAVTLLPLLVMQIFAYMIFPWESGEFAMKEHLYMTIDTHGSSYYLLLGDLYNAYPYMYNFLRMVYAAVLAGAYALVSFTLSLYVHRNRFFVLGIVLGFHALATLILPPGAKPALFFLPVMELTQDHTLMLWLVYPALLLGGSCLAIWYAVKKKDIFL